MITQFMFLRNEKPNLRKLGERVSSYLDVIPEAVVVTSPHLDSNGMPVVAKTMYFTV